MLGTALTCLLAAAPAGAFTGVTARNRASLRASSFAAKGAKLQRSVGKNLIRKNIKRAKGTTPVVKEVSTTTTFSSRTRHETTDDKKTLSGSKTSFFDTKIFKPLFFLEDHGSQARRSSKITDFDPKSVKLTSALPASALASTLSVLRDLHQEAFDGSFTSGVAIGLIVFLIVFTSVAFFLWREYVRIGRTRHDQKDLDNASLTETWSPDFLITALAHQKHTKWLHELFEKSAKKWPDSPCFRVADSAWETTLTFQQMNAKAELIKRVLLQEEFVTGKDQIVAVLLPRDSYHIFACQLGVLKSGAAVLFLDGNLPDEILQTMLQDCQPRIVLCGEQRAEWQARLFPRKGGAGGAGMMSNGVVTAAPASTAFYVCPVLDIVQRLAYYEDEEFLLHNTEHSHDLTQPEWLDDPKERLATVIYTSGSTGKPKAVLSTHKGYVQSLLNAGDTFSLLNDYDIGSTSSSLSYDSSIDEMYIPWLSGCLVVCLLDAQIRSGPDMVGVIKREQITSIFPVPSLLPTISAYPMRDLPLPLLRHVYCGGEALREDIVQPWTAGGRRLVNGYGPTEASICVLSGDVYYNAEHGGCSIGTPHAGTTAVILGVDFQQPLPHGETGELCVGGLQLAKGYLNRPDLTAEKFIEHSVYGRLYRTGDLCKIDAKTKEVHFLGRIDHQVKIRGHRIELQSVEAGLMKTVQEIVEDEEGKDKDNVVKKYLSDIEIVSATVEKQGNGLVGFLQVPQLFERMENLTAISVETSAKPVLMNPTTVSTVTWSERNLRLANVEVTKILQAKIAEYVPKMAIPGCFGLLEDVPRLPSSGKLNRKALPDLSAESLLAQPLDDEEGGGFGTGNLKSVLTDVLSEGPVTELDSEVLLLCQETLKPRTVQWRSHFVKDLGGDSLTIAGLATKLRGHGFHGVAVRDLLTEVASTPAALAKKIAKDRQNSIKKSDSADSNKSSSFLKQKMASVGETETLVSTTTAGSSSAESITSVRTRAQSELDNAKAVYYSSDNYIATHIFPQGFDISSSMGPSVFTILQAATLFVAGGGQVVFGILLVLATYGFEESSSSASSGASARTSEDLVASITAMATDPIEAMKYVLIFSSGMLLVAILFVLESVACHHVLRLLEKCLLPPCRGPQNVARFEKFSFRHYLLWTRGRLEAIWVGFLRLCAVVVHADWVGEGLKLYGADVGENCWFGGQWKFNGELKRVKIGDNVIIRDAVVCTVSFDLENITLADVSIGHGAKLGGSCFVGPGSIVENGAVLEPLAALQQEHQLDEQLKVLNLHEEQRKLDRNKAMLLTSTTSNSKTPSFSIHTTSSDERDNDSGTTSSSDNNDGAELQIVKQNEVWEGVPAVSAGRERAMPKKVLGAQITKDSWDIGYCFVVETGIGIVYVLLLQFYYLIVFSLAYHFATTLVIAMHTEATGCMLRTLAFLYGTTSSAAATASTSTVGAASFFTLFGQVVLFMCYLNTIFACASWVENLTYCLFLRFLPRIPPGSYENSTIVAGLIRKKIFFLNRIQKFCGSKALKPYFLELAGVIFDGGCGCNELANMHDVMPDVTLVGANSFWAGGGFSHQMDYEQVQVIGKNGKLETRLYLTLQRCRFPQNFFVGNHAIILPGNHATNTLIGVRTVAYGNQNVRRMNARLDVPKTFFGIPPIMLGSERQQGQYAKSAEDDTADPSMRTSGGMNKLIPNGDHASGARNLQQPEVVGTTTSNNNHVDFKDEKVLFEPTFFEYFHRFLIYDGLATWTHVVPIALALIAFDLAYHVSYDSSVLAMVSNQAPATSKSGAIFTIAAIPPQLALLFLLLAVSTFTLTLLLPFLYFVLKAVMLGRTPIGSFPLWDLYVQRHFFCWHVAQVWLDPFMAPFEGTLLQNVVYRMLGSKIGKNTLFVNGFGTMDFDGVDVGDNCVLAMPHWQIHTFEDRIFWAQPTRLGDNCVIHPNCTIMGGAELGDNLELMPGSVVMKTEKLEGGQKYAGSPVQPYMVAA
ncbi:unnamed protein product [Amoebophrya sp. A120]|nr:unnamed protein product [Amoebophrya sp. A120]|eukprot:GSA120T00018641001.1